MPRKARARGSVTGVCSRAEGWCFLDGGLLLMVLGDHQAAASLRFICRSTRLVTIAGKPSDTLHPKTWASIVKQAGISEQDR
jgi:hypothetical protein